MTPPDLVVYLCAPGGENLSAVSGVSREVEPAVRVLSSPRSAALRPSGGRGGVEWRWRGAGALKWRRDLRAPWSRGERCLPLQSCSGAGKSSIKVSSCAHRSGVAEPRKGRFCRSWGCGPKWRGRLPPTDNPLFHQPKGWSHLENIFGASSVVRRRGPAQEEPRQGERGHFGEGWSGRSGRAGHRTIGPNGASTGDWWRDTSKRGATPAGG
ncbi:hypothetical protein NDU88_005589 [Pleurodeles waltl]|uniref:Uncharacterized protein n=1 Tax=Pleurodeles waltl TaxID=8319 RepID=A0AAV7WBX3_PLEWA|nr:hypothetical protein NDU88_005589 [Pleurodeles waltl]